MKTNPEFEIGGGVDGGNKPVDEYTCALCGHYGTHPDSWGHSWRPRKPDKPVESSTDQTPVKDRQLLVAESTHFYFKDGRPCYEVPRAKGDGMRPTTLADARKLDLVPSYSEVAKVAAKPGLELWKTTQILHAALTLPQLPDETLDDYAVRVMEDSKAQSKAAADKGTQLHAAIEKAIQAAAFSVDDKWSEHILAIIDTLKQHGIGLGNGKAEHSFASPLGYGGKIDFHNDEPLIIDFKTKETIEDKKQLAWPEHIQQLAAYGFGLFERCPIFTSEGEPVIYKEFRALNVFIGVNDRQVRVIEYEWPDIVEAFAQFRCLLEFWQRIKKFGPYASLSKKP